MKLRVVERKRAACEGMLFPDDPHSPFSESDRFGEPVIVLFEVNVAVKGHRDIA